MKLSYLSWLKRTWPLTLSALAAWGIVHLLPRMYSDFEFSRHGIPVVAWYTDLNQDDDFFRYAYVVGEITYGGQAPWNDADSKHLFAQPSRARGKCIGLKNFGAGDGNQIASQISKPHRHRNRGIHALSVTLDYEDGLVINAVRLVSLSKVLVLF